MTRPHRLSRLIIFSLFILVLRPWSNTWAAGSGAPVESQLSAEKLANLDIKEAPFAYDSMSKPDPFRPFFDFSKLERAIPTDTSKPITPLEKYALNQFALVGVILAGNDMRYALMEDPENIGYTVHEGDKIGNLSGRVKEIRENTVIIEEPYLDIFDQQQMRTITLKLRETDLETPLVAETTAGR